MSDDKPTDRGSADRRIVHDDTLAGLDDLDFPEDTDDSDDELDDVDGAARSGGDSVPDHTELRVGVAFTDAPTINSGKGATLDEVLRGVGEDKDSQGATGRLAVMSRFGDLGELGAGGMGSVHEAHDQILLRKVALKVIHPNLASHAEHTQRFLEEVQITAQLDHPNIVPVHDVGFREDGHAFFVMKLVQGETLSDILYRHRGRPLESRRLEELLQIFIKVCDAIAFAHSRNVIHRDLKPANIMVGGFGQVYVMDWGIALVHSPTQRTESASHEISPQLWRPTESHRMSGASLMGTSAYMAPEQAHARLGEIDFRTDVFGLGGILYEILTDQPPYSSENPTVQLQMAKDGDVLPPHHATPRRLPPGLSRIAMKALAKRREARYQTVTELKQEVSAFLRGGGWLDTLRFPAGTDIVAEGEEAGSAYIIESGRCEVFKTIGKARHVLRELGPGDVFGETAIFTGKPRTASVTAITDVTAVAITAESLDQELAQRPFIGLFVKSLAERFRERDSELTAIQTGEFEAHRGGGPSED